MSISAMEFDSFGYDSEPNVEPTCPIPDVAIEVVWRAAMTCALNLLINRQNRLNEDDGAMDVLNEQGECINEMKQYREIDGVYLAEVRSMLAYRLTGEEPPTERYTQCPDCGSHRLAGYEDQHHCGD